MDTQHSPAQIVHAWLKTYPDPSPPCKLYYHLIPEGAGIDVAALVLGNSSGDTQRSHKGPQYTQHGVQVMGRGDSIAEARKYVTWAMEALATIKQTQPGQVEIDGVSYLLLSASRFGTIADIGQTEKHRNSMATQDYRVTINLRG